MSGTTRKPSGRVPRMLGSQHAPWAAAALAAVLMSASPLAQTPPAAAAAPAATVGQDGPIAESDDITALVAPIALYPDPLLSVILQASTLPIQIVQAQRFLDKRASDPKAAPDPEWDRSIMALLNYPSLVQAMSEYIDWTEELGNAVLDRLENVQEEIQQIRWSAHTTGILVSNSAQKVVVEGNVIAINPVKDAVIQIPKYDPAALLAAIEPATATVDIESAVPVTAAAPVTTEAPATAEAPAAVAPATTAAAPVEAAPATAPAPAYAPAPAPVYEQAPVYAAAPAAPVVAYSEPQSSFWSSAAPFLGGAAIGGLLGYALADDDDDDDDDGYNGCREDCYYGGGGRNWDSDNWDSDNWDSDNWNGNGGNNKQNKQYQNNKQNNINVEGNNVVVVDNDKLKKDLNANRNRVQGDRGGAGTGGRTQGRQEVSALPASRSGQADRTQANRGQGASATPASRAAAPAKRDVRLPSPGGKPPGAQATAQPQRVQSAEQRQRTQSKSLGQAKPQTSAALGNGQDSKRAAEAQASRGAQSRAAAPAAPTRQPAAAPRPQQQQAQAPQRQQQRAQGPQAQKSGGGMRVDSGQRAQRDSARGQQSRGDGGGGRGGGGGGRGGGGGGGRRG